MALPDLFELHRELVQCRSESHSEGAIADLVEGWLRGLGAVVERFGDNVIARAGRGPHLLLNSHLDTVPATPSWTRDPWMCEREGERIYGLGSNDAKASVAAMMKVFEQVVRDGGPAEVTLLLVPEEETGGKGMEVAWPHLAAGSNAPLAAVVGEPTGLDIAVAQKGLLILELIAEGDACHSANADALEARNAIRGIARDIVALDGVDLGPEHPVLGAVTLQPTVLRAGERRNQLPAEASVYLDLRTHPDADPETLAAAVQARVASRVRVHSSRLRSRATDPGAAIVLAARDAAPDARVYGSRTLSDWAYLTIPAVKVGPGRTERSHTADEFVLASELEDGVAFYSRLIHAFAARG
ncbi:MAG: M20/M25/M40 family metallo-hydrolase [Planctomycetota bacterium]